MAKVLKIFICADKGQPMQEVQKIKAIQGVGLEGDRYASGKGAWSNSKTQKVRHVSLISIEALRHANAGLKVPFLMEEIRRNILVSCTAGELNALVGKKFTVGEVLLLGTELCDPCGRPTQLAKKEGFDIAFAGRGGLRAEILSSGEIVRGDEIRVVYARSSLLL